MPVYERCKAVPGSHNLPGRPWILRPMTDAYIRSMEAQILGRVFTHHDAIHFVLGTDTETEV